MRRAFTMPAALGLIALGACTPTPVPEDAAAPARMVAFQCATGERVAIALSETSANLTPPGGASVPLAQQPTGSGIWYEGGGHTLRGKGEEITWTAPGAAPRQCTADGAASPSASQSLAGTRWQLVQFQSSDDAIGTITPPDPSFYTLSFGADGRLAARLDCNRGMAGWSATPSATGGSLTLTPGAMTRAMCGPNSMDTRIAADFARIRSYTLVGDTLNLALAADGGIYTWRKMP